MATSRYIKKKKILCKIHNNNFKGEDFIVERTKAAAANTLLYVLNAAQLKASLAWLRWIFVTEQHPLVEIYGTNLREPALTGNIWGYIYTD